MAEDDTTTNDDTPIIIKKIVKGGGHHGGAWKVAYADFVTAMMAFFLLLWLLSVSTEEELKALAGQFQPDMPTVSESASGSGGLFGGTSMSPRGAMQTTFQPVVPPQGEPRKVKTKVEKAKEELRKLEEKKMQEVADQLRKKIRENPKLKDLQDNLIIDMTPEGLRIQIIDQDGKPLFASGSAQMFEKTRALLASVAETIQDMPNELSIRGHTDSVPYGSLNYTNWELSADRANASRRVIEDSGIPASRLNNVVGKAATDPLLKDDPENPQNRRISIILLKEELTNPNYDAKAQAYSEEVGLEDDGAETRMDAAPATRTAPIGTFRRTPGNVEFP